MAKEAYRYPAYVALHPLRVPAGWHVIWNTLESPSSEGNDRFGGSSIFTAKNEARRFLLDVEFRPEFDPNGHFRLSVLYQPWPRTPTGARQSGVPLAFDSDAETVHSFETTSHAEVIDQLENWIARCTLWVREGN